MVGLNKRKIVIEIPLSTQGKHKNKFVAMISEDDKDLAFLKWSVDKGKYAYRRVNGKVKYLHAFVSERFLGERKKGYVTDHINRNGLDNQRCNIRYIPHCRNLNNKGLRTDNKSGFTGVYWNGYSWYARITVDKKFIKLGKYENINEAIKARKIAERKLL
jgi:hypothetical protein